MEKYLFGVDLGGTTVKIGLFDENKQLLEKWEIPTRKDNGGSFILDDIALSIRGKMSEKCIADSDVTGIGIGVPGAVTKDGVVNKCINLGWGVFNVEEVFSQKMGGIKVKAGNDANVAALGEYAAGAGKKYSSMVFVTIGTGVGGGIVLDGNIIAGKNGAAAEIGHLPIAYDEEEVCNCGKKGCLEQIAGSAGIVRQAARLLDGTNEPSSLRNIQYISVKAIFDEAKKGDKLALQVVDNTARYLGIALANVGCMFDPECFIIGGGVSYAGEFLIDKSKVNYQANVFHASRGAHIELATLGNDAGMYGAVNLF
ncbi:MAG: ROK family glucokinase [Lachnospiraceae bacterium]